MNSTVKFFFRAAFRYRLTWLVMLLLLAAAAGMWLWFAPSPAMGIVLALLAAALFGLWLLLLAGDKNFHHLSVRLGGGIDHAVISKAYQLEDRLRQRQQALAADQLRALREHFDQLSQYLTRHVYHGRLAFGGHLLHAGEVFSLAVTAAGKDAAGAEDDSSWTDVEQAAALFAQLNDRLRATPLNAPADRLKRLHQDLQPLYRWRS